MTIQDKIVTEAMVEAGKRAGNQTFGPFEGPDAKTQCDAAYLGAIYTAMRAADRTLDDDALHIVFDGPPGPEAGRFVECETTDGRSVKAGEWHERADGLWELRIADRLQVKAPETGEGW